MPSSEGSTHKFPRKTHFLPQDVPRLKACVVVMIYTPQVSSRLRSLHYPPNAHHQKSLLSWLNHVVFDELNYHRRGRRDIWCITIVKPGNTRKHSMIEHTVAITRKFSRCLCCHVISPYDWSLLVDFDQDGLISVFTC